MAKDSFRWHFRYKGKANAQVIEVEITTRTNSELEATEVAKDYLQRNESSPAVRFLSVKPIEAWSTDRMEQAKKDDLAAKRKALELDETSDDSGRPPAPAPPLAGSPEGAANAPVPKGESKPQGRIGA